MAVLDVNLNGEMSYPIADALVARNVPFVFVTGYDKDRMLDGYQTFSVLQKPFHRRGIDRHAYKIVRAEIAERRTGGMTVERS